MAMRQVSLGQRSIDDIHEQAIHLWIQAKLIDPDKNPADGIFFALTDELRPPELPMANNAIDLCLILNKAFGLAQPTDEQVKTLNAKALATFIQYEEKGGRMPLRIAWVNRVAYALALLSLVVSGWSWLIFGLVAAVWLCNGAARTAVQMQNEEPRPSWESPLIIALHWAAITATCFMSVVRLVIQFD